MNYKRIIFILSIICILFSVTSVCANEVNNTVLTQNGDTIDEQISSDENAQKIETLEEGSFNELNNEIQNANAELKLTKNYTYQDTDEKFSKGINITKIITINGNGFTINGNNKAQPFKIDNSMIIIKNINFINCVGENGGSIYCQNSNIQITNSTFINSQATNDGGAIYFRNSYCQITNSTFINSQATNDGGAIYLNKNTEYCLIYNSTFTKNTAKQGGAVFFSSKLNEIYNSNFIKNSATQELGGALFIDQNYVSLYYSNFIENFASYAGGAIYFSWNNEVNSEMIRCQFINNTRDKKQEDGYFEEGYIIGKQKDVTIISKDHLHATLAGFLDEWVPPNFEVKQKTIIATEKYGNSKIKIIVYNPNFSDNGEYHLILEKEPFPLTHPKSTLNYYNIPLVYDGGDYYYAIDDIPINKLGENIPFRIYYNNMIEERYHYFNLNVTVPSSLTVPSLSSHCGSTTILTAIVKDYKFGGNLEFNIGGKKYVVPVNNGWAEVPIKLPNKAGTFNYKVTFNSNSKYVYSSSANLKIITKWKTKITIKSVKGYQGKTAKLKAIIKDSSGKKITKGTVRFEIITKKYRKDGCTYISGNDYIAKIKNGVATIKIKYPKAKFFKTVSKTKKKILTKTTYYKSIYNGQVYFEGYGNYLPTSSTFKITSKKKPVVKKYRIVKSTTSKKTTTSKSRSNSNYEDADIYIRDNYYKCWFKTSSGQTLGNLPVTYKIYTGSSYKEYKSQTDSLGFVYIYNIPKGTHKIYIEGRYLLDTTRYSSTFKINRQ